MCYAMAVRSGAIGRGGRDDVVERSGRPQTVERDSLRSSVCTEIHMSAGIVYVYSAYGFIGVRVE